MEPRRQKHLSKLEHDRKQKEFASGAALNGNGNTNLLEADSRRIAAERAAPTSLMAASSDDLLSSDDNNDGAEEKSSNVKMKIPAGHADRRFLTRRQQGAGEGYGSVSDAGDLSGQMSDADEDGLWATGGGTKSRDMDMDMDRGAGRAEMARGKAGVRTGGVHVREDGGESVDIHPGDVNMEDASDEELEVTF